MAAVSNGSGKILRQEEFKPFGDTLAGDTGTATYEEGFQGLRTDQVVVGGTRAYDSTAGRWLEETKPCSLTPTG